MAAIAPAITVLQAEPTSSTLSPPSKPVETIAPVPDPSLSNAQRFKALHAAARFGNYHSYYTKFREQNVPDTRLSIIPTSLLQNARVLDLGCNAGKLTAEVLDHFGASKAVGVDLDPYLIEQAKSLYCGDAQKNLSFELMDIMDHGESGPWASSSVLSTQEFDIVFLFSITKWLHLNHGDEALLELFRRIHGVLTNDGHLVVEPQDWENYARAAKKNAALKPMYKKIRLRPPFQKELEDVGFVQIIGVDRDEFGFERSVHVWRKLAEKIDTTEGTNQV